MKNIGNALLVIVGLILIAVFGPKERWDSEGNWLY